LAPFLPDHTEATCADACWARVACKAFTFNVTKNACFLKSGYGQPKRNSNAVSGAFQNRLGTLPEVPSSSAFDIKVGIDFLGGDLYNRRPVSLEQCQALCVNEDRCVAFSYTESKNWCWLKSALTPPRRSLEVVSGIKP
jgi:hypothetical protein